MNAPKEGVRPPGETAWLAYASVYGGKIADWDDLEIADKIRWAWIEETTVENVLAQSNSQSDEATR